MHRFHLILFKFNWERKFRILFLRFKEPSFKAQNLLAITKYQQEKRKQRIWKLWQKLACFCPCTNPRREAACAITVSPLCQKSDRNIQKLTYFPLALLGTLSGINVCKTPTCVFWFVSDPYRENTPRCKDLTCGDGRCSVNQDLHTEWGCNSH